MISESRLQHVSLHSSQPACHAVCNYRPSWSYKRPSIVLELSVSRALVTGSQHLKDCDQCGPQLGYHRTQAVWQCYHVYKDSSIAPEAHLLLPLFLSAVLHAHLRTLGRVRYDQIKCSNITHIKGPQVTKSHIKTPQSRCPKYVLLSPYQNSGITFIRVKIPPKSRVQECHWNDMGHMHAIW